VSKYILSSLPDDRRTTKLKISCLNKNMIKKISNISLGLMTHLRYIPLHLNISTAVNNQAFHSWRRAFSTKNQIIEQVCKWSACTVGLLVGSMPNCSQFSGRLWVCWHTVRNQNRTLLHPGRSLVAFHVKYIYWAGTMFGYDLTTFSYSTLNVGCATLFIILQQLAKCEYYLIILACLSTVG
jgi:hypothetical protein